jgi:hypothetical protein
MMIGKGRKATASSKSVETRMRRLVDGYEGDERERLMHCCCYVSTAQRKSSERAFASCFLLLLLLLLLLLYVAAEIAKLVTDRINTTTQT